MAKTKAQTNANAKRAPRLNPGAFLDLPPEASAYEKAAVVVLPMPLEESVSYGGGTAGGPEAIITASQQVELYDMALDREPAMEYGIHTLPPAFAARTNAGDALEAIKKEAEKHLKAGKFVLGLGGEHTASLGLARAVAAAKGEFTLVHIDAHADLRDTYEGNPLSHACVVRRIAELPECRDILQLGIRSTTGEQAEFARSRDVTTWGARDMHRDKRWKRELKRAVRGKRVFLTFDVDGLDPAIGPATGTPEPDGLTWRQLLRVAEIVAENAACCLSMDCVELAPVPELRYADFTVARALYAMLTLFVPKAGR
ncbi:MAG: agmatinase [Planctomycetota bacterium]|nr:agmatinase [Planctomycetota bacterium]